MTTAKKTRKPKPYQPQYPLFTRHYGDDPADTWVTVDQFPLEMDVSDILLAGADDAVLRMNDDLSELRFTVANGRATYRRQEPQADKRLAARGASRYLLVSCHVGATPTMDEAED